MDAFIDRSSRSYNTTNNIILFYLFLFIIWPFGSFLLSIINYNKRWAHVIFLLFTSMYGYLLFPTSEDLDLYKIQLLVPKFYEYNIYNFILYITGNAPDVATGVVDLYREVVAFIVSRFTNNASYMMFVFGLVFGYVYLKSILLLFKINKGKNIYLFILWLCFSFIFGLNGLAGVRFSTAAYIFFIGAINVIVYNKKKYIFVASLSLLVHFAFAPALFLLAMYTYIKKTRIYYIIFFISFFLSYMVTFLLKHIGLFQVTFYTDTEYINTTSLEQAAAYWYIKYSMPSVIIFSLGACIYIKFILKGRLNVSYPTECVFNFLLLLLSVLNMTRDIPSFAERYWVLFVMFFFYYLYRVYTENPYNLIIKKIVLLSLPFCTLQIVGVVRSILGYTSIYLYSPGLNFVINNSSTTTAWDALFK